MTNLFARPRTPTAKLVLLGVAVFVGGCAAPQQKNAVSPLEARSPSTEQIVRLVEDGYYANLSAVRSAHGTATLTFDQSFGNPPALKHGFTFGSGEERRQIEWWFDAGCFRTDEDSLPIDGNLKRFGETVHLRTVWNDDTRIYFNRNAAEAYINAPLPTAFRFVRDSTAFFDPRLFYEVDQLDLNGWLNYIHERKMSLSVKQSSHDVFDFNAEGMFDDGITRHIDFTVDGNVGFNVTCMRFTVIGKGISHDPTLDFHASYARSDRSAPFFPKIYMLKKFFDFEHKNSEYVHVEFETQSVNRTIDPNIFTFNAIGVPDHTLLTDLRGDLDKFYRLNPALSSKGLTQLASALAITAPIGTAPRAAATQP